MRTIALCSVSTILAVVFISGCDTKTQTKNGDILTYFSIHKIATMWVTCPTAPTSSLSVGGNKVDDPVVLKKAERLLSQLPSKGSVWKSFPNDMPHYNIEIVGESGRSGSLVIFGMRLQCPQNNAFCMGPNEEEKEFVGLIIGLCEDQTNSP